jgi:anthraniloyl-CoA monooxygenase
LERKPVVEIFQKAARESQAYFETLKRYMTLDPMQFTFNLLTRSGRITYDDLRLRDPRFGDKVDRWTTQKASLLLKNERFSEVQRQISIAPPPLFTPISLRNIHLLNRIVLQPLSNCAAQHGTPVEEYTNYIQNVASSGAALVVTEPVAISAEGRITPESSGLYNLNHLEAWQRSVEFIHSYTLAKVAVQLNHAGRRGSTRSRAEGLDRPLSEGNWPLLSASAIPYSPTNQVPNELSQTDMDSVREDFVLATQRAHEAGFDILQLNFAQGYLVASFISPLTNLRQDEYGGDLTHRMRFPLEVFAAVRAAWPQEKPISVIISVSDCVKGGFDVDNAVVVAQIFKEHGCDIIAVVAGQTTIDSEPTYSRGFLTPSSDRIRNEAGILTMVGGYITSSDEVNTLIAAGRADLCIMDPPQLNDMYWVTSVPQM